MRNDKPLLHSLIFLIEMAIVSKLMARFNTFYTDKPGKQILRPTSANLQYITPRGSS